MRGRFVAAACAGSPRHNRTDPRDRRVGTQRHEPQDGIDPRVGQARHRAEDARNADLRRFRRVEIVRLPASVLARIRDDSLASHGSVLPILLAPSLVKDAQRDEWIRECLKANTMCFRPTTLAVVTSGLIVAAGLTGCQVPRTLRSFEMRPLPWRRTPQTLPRDNKVHEDSETYIPRYEDDATLIPQPRFPQPTIPDRQNLRLPEEPTIPSDRAPDLRPIPVPPAAEVDAPQARRWKPSPPNRPAGNGPQHTSQSDSALEDFNLPPARVTYNTEATTPEPTNAPAAEQNSAVQPRLFHPSGTARNMFDTMKRKLTR